jgi:non-ribosomal peptide synthase protein (TIGR01720 family)
MMKGGRRVEVEEIEGLLEQERGVKEAAVVVWREEGEAEGSLIGIIVRKEGEEGKEVKGEELQRLVEEKMAGVRLKKVMEVEGLRRGREGRINRGAVERMVRRRAAAGSKAEYEEAGTEVERILVRIWEEVLNVEKVGVHDNFFQLGGDSILSIQVISRARQEGVELTPRQLFEKQTVGELAMVAGQGVAVVAEQGRVSGRVALTPFQAEFFAWGLAKPEHFNQAVLLELKMGVESELMEQAVRGLLEQHDALRMRYREGGEGWEQWCEEEAGGGMYERKDLRGMEWEEQKKELEREGERAQGSLDLKAGRMMKAVEYEMGGGKKRLLVVIHHLVVDGVSWRILLEDLERGYQQLKKGGEVRLGKKTTSFQQWAQRLEEYGGGEGMREEMEYWSRQGREKSKGLRMDYEGVGQEENLVGTQQTVTEELEGEETRGLLQEVPKAYNTQINDVLLTALGRTLGEWSGEEAVLVALEGHGREEIFADLDVSRTVGWFTSTYPVMLERGERGEWQAGKALSTVKERLRGVPNRGLGYGLLRWMSGDEEMGRRMRELPEAEIIFNYLGQVDQVMRSWELFAPSGESSGSGVALENRRPYVLDVSGMVVEGRLRMNWAYSEKLHRRETIAKLARQYMQCLRELIAHCCSDQAGGFTPSDFPVAAISEQHLQELAAFLND